jgi:hypothetical protein
MTKQELFKKYSIDESHKEWDNQIDNWMSVEIYRIMHNGELPPKDDLSINWILDFLDKTSDPKFFVKLRQRKSDDFGSLYLTAKRMIYKFADQIIKLK